GVRPDLCVCQECAHLSGEMNGYPMGTRRSIPECLLFGAPIEPDDAVLLCVHFQPKSEREESSLGPKKSRSPRAASSRNDRDDANASSQLPGRHEGRG